MLEHRRHAVLFTCVVVMKIRSRVYPVPVGATAEPVRRGELDPSSVVDATEEALCTM